MELQMNILISALLASRDEHGRGWRVAPFETRLGILHEEWEKFSRGAPALSKFLQPTYGDVRKAKTLRDAIAHKEFLFRVEVGGDHSIQFYNKTRTKQKTKPYYVADFIEATEAAARAASIFFWVTEPDSKWPLPDKEADRLRALPSTEHLKIPT